MASHQTNLVVVAHPDDEAIFFAGLIMSKRQRPWHVICVTDGNADGRGDQRLKELHQSCKTLKVKTFERWDYPDIYEKRLPVGELVVKLKGIPFKIGEVYTHGVLGEYGHPHHQDVSYAVHCSFALKRPVWSVAYNCRPEKIVRLSPRQFELKRRLLNEVYAQETRKFLQLLPVTGIEEFVKHRPKEVTELYQAICENRSPDPKFLHHFRGWETILPQTFYWQSKRLF